MLQGWEAVGRLRVSEGIVVERYYGPHARFTLTDLTFASVNADTSLAVELRHSDKLVADREIYLQFALLFTDSLGNRRVRYAAPLPLIEQDTYMFGWFIEVRVKDLVSAIRLVPA